jgi:hypothetical protein
MMNQNKNLELQTVFLNKSSKIMLKNLVGGAKKKLCTRAPRYHCKWPYFVPISALSEGLNVNYEVEINWISWNTLQLSFLLSQNLTSSPG